MSLLLSTAVDFSDIALVIALAVVGGLLAAAGIFAFVTRIIIWVTYIKYNRIANSEGLTAEEAANKFKDLVGLESVDVKQCSWWRALLSTGGALGFGNNYSIYKKAIFLRRNIINKKSITAVGVATQKVGLALQDKENNKTYQFTARVKPFVLFAPVMFVPFIVIGVLLDFWLFDSITWLTLIFAGIAVLYYFLAFVVILFTVKVEKKANKTALKLMEENNFLTAEERGYIQKLYNTYILAYIADFIVALLEFIRVILKALTKIKKK